MENCFSGAIVPPQIVTLERLGTVPEKLIEQFNVFLSWEMEKIFLTVTLSVPLTKVCRTVTLSLEFLTTEAVEKAQPSRSHVKGSFPGNSLKVIGVSAFVFLIF